MIADSFRLLYSAQDATGTVQLWASDGSAAGTSELTAVANDWGGLYPQFITPFATGEALFAGIDASDRTSLWRTDGSAAGTAELQPAGAYGAGLDPKALTVLGAQVLFTATDAAGQTGLWASDGSDAGTVELLRLDGVGAGITDPVGVVAGGRVFFDIAGRLVVSDGSAAGTAVLAAGLASGSDGPRLTALGETVLFSAGGQLWRSDGATTSPITAIAAPHATLSPADITEFGADALFRGIDAAGNTQLWITDGSAAGTHALTDFASGSAAGFPLGITDLAGRAIFFADDAKGGLQLWSSDGTAGGTTMLTELKDTTGSGLAPTAMAVVGGRAIFTSLLGGLWSTDGTAAGTVDLGGPNFASSAAVLGDMALVASPGQILLTDGTASGTHLLVPAAYADDLTVLPADDPALAQSAPLPCFLPGTRVLTRLGEVAVEALRPGDSVHTAFGGWQELRWVGSGTARLGASRTHPARPVRIRADALGPGVPARDLVVTQGHCLLFPAADGPGALIPAALLVNGRSILLEPGEGEVTYHHIGLAGHDVVLADGAACETWHDDGSALRFDPPPRDVGAGPPCAPKHGYGPEAAAIWRALWQRAGGGDQAGEPDPGLHLLADGKVVRPDFRRGPRYRFSLPRRPLDLLLLSRSAIPAETGLGPDIRRLGVGVREIQLAQGGRLRALGPADRALGAGFHPTDPDEGLRWTSGAARLDTARLRLARGRLRLQIDAVGLPAYPRAP